MTWKSKFSKTEKMSLGIHPSNTCAKFQKDLIIYTFPRRPWRFLFHLGSRQDWDPRPQKSASSKNWKKYPQGFTQAIRVPYFRNIWPYMPSLEHPKACRTDTQTHTCTSTCTCTHTYTHTHTHIHTQTHGHTYSKILAQLKLRKTCSQTEGYFENL